MYGIEQNVIALNCGCFFHMVFTSWFPKNSEIHVWNIENEYFDFLSLNHWFYWLIYLIHEFTWYSDDCAELWLLILWCNNSMFALNLTTFDDVVVEMTTLISCDCMTDFMHWFTQFMCFNESLMIGMNWFDWFDGVFTINVTVWLRSQYCHLELFLMTILLYLINAVWYLTVEYVWLMCIER